MGRGGGKSKSNKVASAVNGRYYPKTCAAPVYRLEGQETVVWKEGGRGSGLLTGRLLCVAAGGPELRRRLVR